MQCVCKLMGLKSMCILRSGIPLPFILFIYLRFCACGNVRETNTDTTCVVE